MGSTSKSSAQKKAFIKSLTEHKVRKDIIKLFADIDLSIFFDSLFEDRYYTDNLIPVGLGQTGDNPLTLALMLHYLNPAENERILEIGTGSGYSTALLSMLCREVYTVEYIEELALIAKNRLYNYEFDNIRFYAGDGTEQCSLFETQFDKVIIHAGCRKRPLKVISVLKEKGTLVFPMGPALEQQIIVLQNYPDEKSGDRFITQFHDFCSFNPVKGAYGLEAPDLQEVLAKEPEQKVNTNSKS